MIYSIDTRIIKCEPQTFKAITPWNPPPIWIMTTSTQDEDDDIEALASILGWNDEDEAGIEESVAVTSSALENQFMAGCSKLSSLNFTDEDSVFRHQFSGLSDESDSNGETSFVIPMPNPVNNNAAQTQQCNSQSSVNPNGKRVLPREPTTQQPQQVMNTTQPPLKHPTQNASVQSQLSQTASSQLHPPVRTAVNSGVSQRQQATNTDQCPVPAPRMMQFQNFPMFQQPSFLALLAPNSQQAVPYGMVQMMMQQAQASQQQQPHQPSQQQEQIQQNLFNKMLLQQAMLQAQQQAEQKFSTQHQPPQMAMNGLPPRSIPSMAAWVLHQQIQTPVPESKKPAKRKAPSSSPPAVKGQLKVVTCSDTDGETSGKNVVSTDTKYRSEKAGHDASGDEHAVDTSNMNPEEKAKANRDRNREHARNTRLRKKAHLERLSCTVDELCRERDTLVTEQADTAMLLVELHNKRTEVLMSFFALRSANEQRRELWANVLDESCFVCIMPVTPYRSFPASEVQVSKCQRTVMGIDGMMSDTASLHVTLNTLIDRSRFPTASIEFRFTLVSDDVVVAGNQMMARWTMSTINAVQYGAQMEVGKQGMLCARFNSAHKIVALELMFDVMAFMLQLKQATGSDSFSVVPNTVQTCQRSFDKPMVMTLAEPPYTIVQVNKLWEDMTGYKAEDVVGKTSCQVLQGQETDRRTLDTLMTAVLFKRAAFGVLINYTRTRVRFYNHLTLYPLSTDSKISHYLALTTHTEVIGGPDTIATTPNLSSVPVASHHVTTTQPLMSQSMVPGAMTTPLLGNILKQGGPPMIPHTPLGFFSPQVSIPTPMPMSKILPPVTGPPTVASATKSTSSSDSHSRNEVSRESVSILCTKATIF